MALAILEKAAPVDESMLRFDIGKNQYYRYEIGKEKHRNNHGIWEIDEPSFVSPVIGPVAETTLGRGELDIPDRLIDKENRLVQLMSFRTKKLDGPAYSRVIQLQPKIQGSKLPKLPQLTLSQDTNMQQSNPNLPVRPFSYAESKMSEAMFFGAIAGMLPKLLPMVGNIFGGLFGGGKGGSKGGAASGGDALQALIGAISKPEMIEQITKLIGTVAGGAAKPAEKAQAKALAEMLARPPQLSEAKVAPALLAALPALMPILQQVLNPETIKSVLDAPTKHVGTLINGFKDVAKIGIESHEQDLKHLRELNPGVADKELHQLLMTMSLGVRDMAREVTYKRVTSVTLKLPDIVTTTLFGRSVTPYHSGRALTFPVTVNTPKAIGNSIVDLVLKKADSLEIVHHMRTKFDSVKNGPLPDVPMIEEEVVRSLEPNADYVVCLTLVWKNKQGKKRGTSIQQHITLVGDYVFDRVEESSELIPLTDADRFRDYWHKIWQGQFSKDAKRYEFQLKYYYVLKKGASQNARLESLSKIERGERRRTGKLKSGMDLSAAALNQLIPQLRPGASTLSEAELLPLTGGDFAERFNQCAHYNGKLRGRAGDVAAIWVYPEVKLQQIILQRVTDVNATGNVKGFAEHPVVFPIPAIIHFIGARSA